MRKGLGFLVALLAVLFWKFGLPMIIAATEAASDTQWNDAKTELKASWLKDAIPALDAIGMDLDSGVLDKMATCYTDRIVDFLNTTDCKYKYVKGVSSEAEHLAEQEACMRKVGFEAKQEALELKCIQEHTPKKWSIMRPMLIQGLGEAITAEEIDAPTAKKIATCVSDKIIEVCDGLGCDPVNRTTEKSEDWIVIWDSCLEGKEKESAIIDAAWADCAKANGMEWESDAPSE